MAGVNCFRTPAHRALWRTLGDLKNVLRAIDAAPPAQAEKTFLKQSEDAAGLGSAEELLEATVRSPAPRTLGSKNVLGAIRAPEGA